MSRLLLALGLLSSAVTADYTTTLLLLGFGNQSVVGSVIATDATATTYSVTCPAAVGTDCGIPPSFTITQGPSTMHYEFAAEEDANGNTLEEIDAECKITTDHGLCSGSQVSAGTSSPGSGQTWSYSNYGTEFGAQAVTITAGPTPGATGSDSSISSTSATTSGASAGQTSSNSGSSTSSSSGTSKVSTGGMPMITGHAQWVIGGAAAAVAIAAI
ncbi:hypothetical protein OIDMADRAFT_33275 [Oidiodendron maius Zn]|uniref:GPI anchored protein n=1 Tax=Oidiodendron maius (strain Zn) TaxID=913774 RepID=A0A0C3CA99_OIDMZ|nr:hypothetical protein OIDMADRAFT_33275 [Oidiodendron maius Zn]